MTNPNNNNNNTLFNKSFDQIMKERDKFLNAKTIDNPDESWYETLRQYAAFSAENGDLEGFNKCVAKQKFWGDKAWKDETQENLLHYACRGGNADIIKSVSNKFKEQYGMVSIKESTYTDYLLHFGEYLAKTLDDLEVFGRKGYFIKIFKDSVSIKKFSEIYSVDNEFSNKRTQLFQSADITNNYQTQRDIDKACRIALRPELFSNNNEPNVKIFKSPTPDIGITDNASEPGYVKETYKNGTYSYQVVPGKNDPESKVYRIVVPNKNKKGKPDFENTTTLYFNSKGDLIHHQFKGRGSGCLDGSLMQYKGGQNIEQLHNEHIKNQNTPKQEQTILISPAVEKAKEIAIGTDPLPDQSEEIKRLKAENEYLKEENQKLQKENERLQAAPLKPKGEEKELKSEEKEDLKEEKAADDWKTIISEKNPSVFETLTKAEPLLKAKDGIGDEKIAETMVTLANKYSQKLKLGMPEPGVNKSLIEELSKDPYKITLPTIQNNPLFVTPLPITEEDYKIADELNKIKTTDNPAEINKILQNVNKKTNNISKSKNKDSKNGALKAALRKEILEWQQLYNKACFVKTEPLQNLLNSTNIEEDIKKPIIIDLIRKVNAEKAIDTQLEKLNEEIKALEAAQETTKSIEIKNALTHVTSKTGNTDPKQELDQLKRDKKTLKDCKQLCTAKDSQWKDINTQLEKLSEQRKNELQKLTVELNYEEANKHLTNLEGLHYNYVETAFNQLKESYNDTTVELEYNKLSAQRDYLQTKYSVKLPELPKLEESLPEGAKQFQKNLFALRANKIINDKISSNNNDKKQIIQEAKETTLQLFNKNNNINLLEGNIKALTKSLNAQTVNSKSQNFSPQYTKEDSICFVHDSKQETIVTRGEFNLSPLSSGKKANSEKKNSPDAPTEAKDKPNETAISKDQSGIHEDPEERLSELLNNELKNNKTRSQPTQQLKPANTKNITTVKNEIVFTKDKSLLFNQKHELSHWVRHISEAKLPEEKQGNTNAEELLATEKSYAEEQIVAYLSKKVSSLKDHGVGQHIIEQLLNANISHILNPSQLEPSDRGAQITLEGSIKSLKAKIMDRASQIESTDKVDILDTFDELGYNKENIIEKVKEKVQLDQMVTPIIENSSSNGELVEKRKKLSKMVEDFALSKVENKIKINMSPVIKPTITEDSILPPPPTPTTPTSPRKLTFR